jgi:hypothetical protein
MKQQLQQRQEKAATKKVAVGQTKAADLLAEMAVERKAEVDFEQMKPHLAQLGLGPQLERLDRLTRRGVVSINDPLEALSHLDELEEREKLVQAHHESRKLQVPETTKLPSGKELGYLPATKKRSAAPASAGDGKSFGAGATGHSFAGGSPRWKTSTLKTKHELAQRPKGASSSKVGGRAGGNGGGMRVDTTSDGITSNGSKGGSKAAKSRSKGPPKPIS